MDNQKVISLLREYESQFKTPAIDSEGSEIDVRRTVIKTNRYMNSLFMGSQVFSNGIQKMFLNITVPAVINTAKNIDLDTKDVFYKAVDPKYRLNAYFLNTKLRQWNGENNMGVFINNANIYHTTYGSCIVKDAEPCPRIINLERLQWDTSIEPVDNTFDLQGDFAIEDIWMTMAQVDEKRGVWFEDAINDLQSKYDEVNKESIVAGWIKIKEAHIYAPRKSFEDGKGYGFYKTYIVDDDTFKINKVLYWEREKKLPYKQVFFDRRNINFGRGVAENVFPEQQNINTIVNYYNQSLAVASLNIFQTPDPTVMKNIFRDARSGDIFNSQLAKVDTSIINPSQFLGLKDALDDSARRKTNSFEVLTGEQLPSNQTLGGQVLQTQQGAKYFGIKRENFGMFLDEIYNDWVLPRFEKSLSKEDVVSILDVEELEDIWTEYTNKRINDQIVKNLLENDTVPTPEDIQAIREQEIEKMEKKNLWKVTKEYLTGFKKKLYIDISGEKHNLGQKISVMSQILLNSNMKDLLIDPVTSKAVKQLLELVGFDANLINTKLAQSIPQQQASGGKTPQSAIQNIAEQFTEQGKVAQ